MTGLARGRRRGRRGHAVVEFALAGGILIPAMAGTFQFGYSFYLYNLLQACAANGSLYAANRTYRTQLGNTDINKGKTAIRNMTVFGAPNPPTGARPLVRGLTTNNVDVTYTVDSNGIPCDVRVSIINYQLNTFFRTYTFNGKPFVRYPYLGRYAPNESEP